MANIFTEEQLNAINSRNSNILVSASAGSGKTAVLVERIIKRIIDEKLEVDKILVVTFTKAAAGELKERIYKALKKALEKNPSDRHLKAQIRNLQLASITTIHSFCLDVIRSNFYKLGLDPNFVICDETKSKLLKNEAITEVLEMEYADSKNQDFGLYNVLELFNMDDNDFISCIYRIWDEINCYSEGMEYLKNLIEEYNIEDSNADLSRFNFGKEILNKVFLDISLTLSKAESFRLKLTEKKDEFKKHIELIDEDIFYLKLILNQKETSWDKLYEVMQSIGLGQMPRTKVEDNQLKEEMSNLRKEVIKKEIDNAKKIIYAKSEYIINSLNKMYKYLLYIYSFLDKVVKRYSLKKNDENLVDFNDIEHYALDILIEKDEKGNISPSIEAKNYIEKFDEIYIDEYQDTSYIQEDLLSAISKVSPGNRFMVGDIKQSIYKFRHAAVDIFIDKYNKYSEESNEFGKKIILAKNFRSRKEVLNGINYIFEQIMTDKVGECNYSFKEVLNVGNTSYIENDSNYKTEINILDFKDDDSSAFESEALEKLKDLKKIEQEALHIASRIDKLVNEEKMQITDSVTKTLRDITYRDICILLRSTKDKATIYEEALKNANIPCYCESTTNFFESDEVNLILSFLSILDNPLNDIELISIMYSILGRFTLDEIYNIKSQNINDYLYNILISWDYEYENKELNSKIKIFIETLNKYMDLVNVLTVTDLIIKVYHETHLYDYTLLLDNPNIRKVNMDSLISISSNINNTYNINEFLQYVSNLKNGNIISSDSPKAISENENVVRIMTIHASKGLEFPVIILANTDKKYSSEDTKSKINIGKYGIGIDYIDEDLKISYPTVIKEAVKYEIICENKSEELRMLYVALTRAKEKIITYLSVKDLDKKLDSIYIALDENGKIDSSVSLSANSYSDIILLGLKKYFLATDKEEVFDINHIFINSEEGLKVFEEYNKKNIINIPKIIESIDENKYAKELVNSYYNEINDKVLSDSNLHENIPRRTSVSALKEKESEEYVINNICKEENNTYIIPTKSDRLTGAKRGTILHLLLEKFIYENINNIDDVKLLINNMITFGIITEEEKNSINIKNIENYIHSNLFNEIKKSRNYKKEVEFVLKNSSYSLSQIQGVIDLYYINENDDVILVDFKTDNLENEKDFIERYKLQLDIYKEALEKLLKKRVVKQIIYSFKLGKEINI